MAVGTDIGRVYDGQQGTGFATVLDYNPGADIAIANQRKAERDAAALAKQKSLAESHKKMMEAKPDYWHRHDQEIMGLRDGWVDMGAAMIANGEDPYTGSSENSVQFRKLAQKIDSYAQASDQLRDEWTKIQQAYVDPEKRKQVENWDDIVSYYDNPSVVDIVENKKRAPQPIFKEPEVDTHKMQADIVKQWQGSDKDKVLSMNDAIGLAAEMQLNDVYSKGFGNADSKMRQRYKAIEAVPELKEAYEARGARNGGIDGYTQFVAEGLYGMTDPTKTLDEFILNVTKDIQTSSSKIEEGDVTIESERAKISDKQLRGVVKSTLIGKEGYIDRDVLAGKYGNPDHNIAKNIKAAEDYYFGLAKNNLKTKYSKTEDETGKAKKENEAARQYWDEAFQGLHGVSAQREAQDFLKSSLQGADKSFVESVIPGAFNLPESAGVKPFVGPTDPNGIQLKILDEDGEEQLINVPLGGTSGEARKALYDRAVKDRGKVFKANEKETIPGISENKIKIQGF